MTNPNNDPLDFERAKQLLPPKALAELATLHGLDTDEARTAVQHWPLGSRLAMEMAGLIDLRDTGAPFLEVSLTPHFDEAVQIAASESQS